MNRPPFGSADAQVDTAAGPAEVGVTEPRGPARALVLLGHGAGGDRTAAVLVSVAAALADAGVVVARFDQPYRVAGRRAPAPSARLDAAATDVGTWLRHAWPGLPLLLGGKSSGARVACRVAESAGAVGVVALGFPLRPPGRPGVSRASELLGAGVPVLVCQGERDAFGSPDDVRAAAYGVPEVAVHAVAGGDHSFAARRKDGRTTQDCVAEVAAVARAWVVAQIAAT